MADRKTLLESIILEAGSGLKRYFGRIGLAHAHTKGQAVDLVSRADIETQERIVRALKRHFPQDGILAEEGDLSGYQDAHAKGGLWVIDPLDGTVNFLHGYPLFGVSIAYCRDGVPELGAIYAVAQDEVYWTVKGKGAHRGHVTPRGITRSKRLKVSTPRELKDALMVTGFGNSAFHPADFA
ncbi:MAG: inositol monophosphatase family protein, partial [Elusimicrobiota bacterium]